MRLLFRDDGADRLVLGGDEGRLVDLAPRAAQESRLEVLGPQETADMIDARLARKPLRLAQAALPSRRSFSLHGAGLELSDRTIRQQ